MSSKDLKNNSILGSARFSFITSVAANSLNNQIQIKKQIDLNSDCSTDNEKDKQSMVVETDEETIMVKTNQSSDVSLMSSFDAGLNFEKLESCSKTSTNIIIDVQTTSNMSHQMMENKDINERFEINLLSKSEKEYENSTLGLDNFLKGCKWSPDGTCILTNSDDSCLRIFDLNEDMLNKNSGPPKELIPSLKLVEPEIIYDYAWYPYMDSTNPATACIFSTSKDNPIHLFDAFTGQIRCSYKGYNHLDELVNAYSIAFDSTASNIYCGYNKCLKIFDITRPGKNFKDVKLNDEQYKLPGIISCIAFSKIPNGIYAVGSYSKYIGIYVENTNEPVFIIQRHSGGLTHLVFSDDGNKLYSGSRKDSEIICWDMRNPGRIFDIFERNVVTNQRIYFELVRNKFLCSGNNNGCIRTWNLNDVNDKKRENYFDLNVHKSCVNGISFHPSMQILATASGQRNLRIENENSSASSENESLDESSNNIIENSLKIWEYKFKSE